MTDRAFKTRQNAFDRALVPVNAAQFFTDLQDKIRLIDPSVSGFSRADLDRYYQTHTAAWWNNLPRTLDEINAMYRAPGYAALLYECIHDWTYKTVCQSIKFMRQFNRVPRSLILTCDGIGSGAYLMAKALPETQITAHILGDVQMDLATQLLCDLPNASVVSGFEPQEPHEAVMAFETLEHFQDPLPFVQNFMAGGPKTFIHTSPWNVNAHGHWPEYRMNGVTVPSDKMGRAFSKWLRSKGYKTSERALGFHFFNGSPAVFIKS